MDICYLRRGNSKQKAAYDVLERLKLFTVLRRYDPVLVGTIPIGIDVANSDLDIICEVHEHEEFERIIPSLYGSYEGFQVDRQVVDGLETTLVSFVADGFCVEIFGQAQPVMKQNGYLHMMIEHRLLVLGGEALRADIRRLKTLGIKTEPAFAYYLGLKQDPYAALLELSSLSDDELLQLLQRVGR